MSERLYHRHREEVFKQCGLNPNDKNYSCHHIIERNDKKRQLIPPNFSIDGRENLVPLPIDLHDLLHIIMDNNPEFKRNIKCRIYLANLAYIDDLDRLNI